MHGRVVRTDTDAPVTSAIIVVTGTADSTIAARGTSGADGAFRIVGLAPGRYLAQVRALGFVPQRVPFTIASATSNVDLGIVRLTEAVVILPGMTVAEERRAVEFSPDRSTFSVSDMPTTRGGSAIDALRNVPSVDVDMDNTITLRGDAGVIVHINGRVSPMKPAQLGNFLAQLPAAMVEKIEVIPNPSARENPEGSAGIINIVLKKRPEGGSSAGVTLAQGTTGRSDVGANLGYRKEGVTFFGSYGFSRDSRPRSESLFRDNLYATPLTFLDEHASRTQIPKIHTLTSSLSYELGKHDELSADLLYSTRREDETYSILYRDLDALRQLTGLRDRASTTINREDSFETTLEHKHSFEREGHELSTEVRFDRASEGGPSNYTSHELALDGSTVGEAARESITPQERPHERSLKIDYVRPLAEHLRVSGGYRGSLQRFHTTLDTRTPDATSGELVVDPTRTTEFTFDQNVNAAYGILAGSAGRLNFQVGLRVEEATTRFERTQTSTGFENRYGSAFPSSLLAYNVDDATQLKLSYSTRIRRPDDTDQLDPTPHYQDPLNLSRGNPSLRPEYIRSMELGFQRTSKDATFQLTPFYRHSADAVRRIRSIDSAGVTTSTFANIATTDSYGTDVTLALHGGRFTGFVGSSAFRQSSNASNVSALLSAHTFGWTARTNVSMRVSSSFDLQTLVSYRGRMTVEQGTNAAQTRVSVAAKQKLHSDRVSLTMRVVDPFGTERERFTTFDPRFTQTSQRKRQVRGVLLNVTWNFGRPLKEKRLDEGDPLSGRGNP